MSEPNPPGQPNPQPTPSQPQYPYGQQPTYGYPPPGYGGQPQPGQPHQGFPQQGFGAPALPKHPQAQTAMVLGIIALAGGATCLLPILVSPFAWFFGAKAKREMMAEPQRWGGQSEAQAGFVMGIIGTAMLVVVVMGLLILALFLGLVASGSGSYN